MCTAPGLRQGPPLAGVDASVGHPVEFIVLNDTSSTFPAVCKYCGLRFYAGHHH